MLIAAGREGRRLPVAEVREQLQISEQELREDVSVLNVVNFGGGAYVIYAEVLPTGEIEVDPEPYSDTFDRPARLLPIEANALVAAIDLIGARFAQGALASAREKIVAALGHDPVEEGLHVTSPTAEDEITRARRDGRARVAPAARSSTGRANEDEFSHRTIEPYALFNGQEAWYVTAVDPGKDDDLRQFRLDRIKSAELLDETFERREDLDPVADVGGWPRTGKVEGSRDRARLDLARAGALGARGAHGAGRAARRRGDRRVGLQGHRLPRARGAQGGRRRRRARAGRRARRGARRRRGPARPQHRRVNRRAAIRMTDEEALAFLDEQRTVICATNGHDGFPHLMPLWYVVRDGTLWAWTYAKSQKTKNLERDPRATLQVETGDAYDQLRGLMLRTEAVLHRDEDDRARRSSRSSRARYAPPGADPEAMRDGLRQAGPEAGGDRVRGGRARVTGTTASSAAPY